MPNYILIGPPGAGKTTVGKALANKNNLKFIDTDHLVESNFGQKISEIFVDKGEEFFRDLEFEALKSALASETSVVALGGGAPISLRAQELLKGTESTIIFLDVSLSVAAPRVGFNRDRPLLISNPRAQWQALADVRKPIYSALADRVITVDGLSIEDIVIRIEGN